MIQEVPTAGDLRAIARQIGRPPRGVAAVARRCPYGFPQVTVTRPLIRQGKEFLVFPTTFWLTCPFLTAAVARLEAAGGVKEFEHRLHDDPELFSRYADAHQAYASARLKLLSPADRAFLTARGAGGSVNSGVGGLTNFRRVKCLHAQLAHFLAGAANPIGAQVAARLGGLFCPPTRVLCRQGSNTGGTKK
ncbi:MAG: DUF501 domain-containing protein [Candidatus Bipolaricaulaceae bacterium]